MAPDSAVHLCIYVCVISNQSTSKKTHLSDLSKLDILLHNKQCKVALVLTYQRSTFIDPQNMIKSNNTLSAVQSPIQPKKKDIKSSRGGEGWKQHERGVAKKF